jgi:hypothetical protein
MKVRIAYFVLPLLLVNALACARLPVDEDALSDVPRPHDGGASSERDGGRAPSDAALARDARVQDAAHADAGRVDAGRAIAARDAASTSSVRDSATPDARASEPVADAQVAMSTPGTGEPNQCVPAMCAPHCPHAVPCCNDRDQCACKLGDGPCGLPPLPIQSP